MKIITKILVAFICLFSISNSAQTKAGTDLNDLQYLQTGGMWVTNQSVEQPIKGSPYLFENWNTDSKIYTKGRIYKIKLFNYNIAQERFEAKFSEDSVLVISTGGIKQININNVIMKPYYDVEANKFTFFEEIGSINNMMVVKKYELKIVEGNFNPMTQKKITPDRYVNLEHLYIVEDDKKPIKRLKLNKSSILNLMDSDSKSQVVDFVRKNKLKYNKILDIHKILDFHNSIEI